MLEHIDHTKNKTIAVLGATGYVGGRLVPRLLEAGYCVRAIGRSVQKLKSRPWADNPNVEIVSADVLDKLSLESALKGCIAAYYLVHSMNPSHSDFSSADKQAAIHMKDVAEEQGLEQIIYLGGLGEDNPSLSHHLKSRAEVGEILKQGKTPVTILRAAMIIGSGSASFEILRYLVDRLPLMVTPKWIDTVSQPIAIRNVLNYLTGCLLHQDVENETFDIGGPDVLTYRELMKIYAEECGLPKRWVIPVPVFTPKLSSYWIHLITPVPAYIAQPLAEGLKNPVVCQENKIQAIIPQELITCREAIQRALRRLTTHQIETHWTDAGKMPPPETVYPDDPNWSGGTVYKDKRTMVVQGTPEQIWKVVVAIGGETGWYYGDMLWKIRGVMDRLIGGVGDRRGRRDPDTLRIGDALDFWRVLSVDVNHKLRLIAEMKVPGQAILGFQLNPIGEDKTEIIQTAWFVPSGLMGILYWYLVTPLHELVFSGMLNGIVKASKTKPLAP